VAGERIRLVVSAREEKGSRESRRLRKQGLVPGVLYGKATPSQAISVEERELRRALTGDAGLHAILDVVVDGAGTAHPSVLKDYQLDALRGRITHVDLQEVPLDQPIQTTVAVALVGDSPGARAGGVLSQVAREVQVEALPMEIPEHIELDVSGLELNATARVADLPQLPGVTYVDDPDLVVATVTAPTREEVVEAEVPEEAPEGGAEAPAVPEADAAGEPGTDE
jgi:large subunit ribosomal protein L25